MHRIKPQPKRASRAALFMSYTYPFPSYIQHPRKSPSIAEERQIHPRGTVYSSGSLSRARISHADIRAIKSREIPSHPPPRRAARTREGRDGRGYSRGHASPGRPTLARALQLFLFLQARASQLRARDSDLLVAVMPIRVSLCPACDVFFVVFCTCVCWCAGDFSERRD